MTARRTWGRLTTAAILCAAAAGCHGVPAHISAGPPQGDAARQPRIAYFVCDRDTPLSVAVPESLADGGKRP